MKSLKIYQGEDSQYQRLSNLKRMVLTQKTHPFLFLRNREGEQLTSCHKMRDFANCPDSSSVPQKQKRMSLLMLPSGRHNRYAAYESAVKCSCGRLFVRGAGTAI